jgi:hypothetical protein
MAPAGFMENMEAQVKQFTDGMKAQAEAINANQGRIEAKLETILSRLDAISPAPTTTEVLENGEPTGVLVHSEKFPQAMIDDVTSGGASDGRNGDGTR